MISRFCYQLQAHYEQTCYQLQRTIGQANLLATYCQSPALWFGSVPVPQSADGTMQSSGWQRATHCTRTQCSDSGSNTRIVNSSVICCRAPQREANNSSSHVQWNPSKADNLVPQNLSIIAGCPLWRVFADQDPNSLLNIPKSLLTIGFTM